MVFDREKEVRRLIEHELIPEGITDKKVLDAIYKVKRENFIPPSLRDRAYGNYPLPIGENQTISQPYIVALMTQALDIKKSDKCRCNSSNINGNNSIRDMAGNAKFS